MKLVIAIIFIFYACGLNRDEDSNIRTSLIQQQLQAAELDKLNKEVHCLTENIIYEAGGESIAGQIAVAQVTLNRVNHKNYPSSICGVVKQHKQFSWTNQPVKTKYDTIQYKKAKIVAINVINKNVKIPQFNEVIFYHTKAVNPKWNRKLIKVAVIGAHIFYKERTV